MNNSFFGRGTNIDKKDLLVKRTIEVPTKAQNKSFFTQFFRTKKTTKIIGFSGQALSGLTEFLGVFLALGGEMPILNWSNILPIFTALFAVFVFEFIGVRIYLVYIVRQLIRKKKNVNFNSAEKWLLGFNIFICSMVLFGNVGTSLVFTGSFFENEKLDTSHKETAKIDSIKLSEINKIQLKYNSLDSVLNINASNQIKDISNKSNKDAATLNNIVYAAREDKTLREKITSNLSNITSQNSRLISDISKRLQDDKKINNELKLSEIKTVKIKAKNQKDAINKSSDTRTGILDIFKRFSLIFLTIFILISIIAIVYEEIFFAGSKTDFESLEIAVKPNLAQVLILGLSQKIYHIGYVLVSFIVGSKRIEYTKILQEKKIYSSEDVKNSSFNGSKIRDFFAKEVQNTQTNNSMQMRYNNDAQNKSAQPQNVAPQNVTNVRKPSERSDSTVRSWYMRSDLTPKSRATSAESAKANRIKYEEYKAKNTHLEYIEGDTLKIRR